MKSVLLLLCFGLASITAYAGPKAVNSEDLASGTVMMEEAAMTKAELKAVKKAEKAALKAEKKELRMEKRLAWANKKLEKHFAKSTKSLGGLSDPIDRWLWYAIIAAGGAIIFSFIFWPIGTILWIASIVFLVLWIVKKFAD